MAEAKEAQGPGPRSLPALLGGRIPGDGKGRIAHVHRHPLAVALVAVLLCMAFGSLVNVLIVLTNVVALGCGGVWALYLTPVLYSLFRQRPPDADGAGLAE